MVPRRFWIISATMFPFQKVWKDWRIQPEKHGVTTTATTNSQCGGLFRRFVRDLRRRPSLPGRSDAACSMRFFSCCLNALLMLGDYGEAR